MFDLEQHNFEINEVNYRINNAESELSKLYEELQTLNHDKGLYNRLNNYIEACAGHIEKDNERIRRMSPFQILLNIFKITKNKANHCLIESRILKALKNHGFKGYTDFLNRFNDFNRTYDQILINIKNKMDDARDNLNELHTQKNLIKNRIKENEKKFPKKQQIHSMALER